MTNYCLVHFSTVPLSFLADRVSTRSTGVRSPRTLTDVLRMQDTSPSKPLWTPWCLSFLLLMGVITTNQVFVYATNQRNVLLDDCFSRAISRLCNLTKVIPPSIASIHINRVKSFSRVSNQKSTI